MDISREQLDKIKYIEKEVELEEGTFIIAYEGNLSSAYMCYSIKDLINITDRLRTEHNTHVDDFEIYRVTKDNISYDGTADFLLPSNKINRFY